MLVKGFVCSSRYLENIHSYKQNSISWQEMVLLRNGAYEAQKPSVTNLFEAFALHLSISIECGIDACLLLEFEQHLYMTLKGIECVHANVARLLLLRLDNVATTN